MRCAALPGRGHHGGDLTDDRRNRLHRARQHGRADVRSAARTPATGGRLRSARRNARSRRRKWGRSQRASAADCAAQADILLTSLPRPDHVIAVMGGVEHGREQSAGDLDDSTGALAALRPGSLWVDLTTNRKDLVDPSRGGGSGRSRRRRCARDRSGRRRTQRTADVVRRRRRRARRARHRDTRPPRHGHRMRPARHGQRRQARHQPAVVRRGRRARRGVRRRHVPRRRPRRAVPGDLGVGRRLLRRAPRRARRSSPATTTRPSPSICASRTSGCSRNSRPTSTRRCC